MKINMALPHDSDRVIAYNEEDRLEKQQNQNSMLESELKSHIIESMRIRSRYLDVMKEAALIARQKPLINFVSKWMEDARVLSEKEYAELSDLSKTNPQMYEIRKKEIELTRNKRAQKYQQIQDKVINLKTEIETNITKLKNMDLDKMKSSGIISDLEINKKTRKVTYTCKGCGKSVEVIYDNMPSIYYGAQVEGVNVPINDYLSRINLPLFMCDSCGKYHILPYQVVNNLKEFAKIHLERHTKAYKKCKDGIPISGISYILADEIYAPCIAIKVDNNVDTVSNMLAKLSSNKLDMAKDIESVKTVNSEADSDAIFKQLMGVYEENISEEINNMTVKPVEEAPIIDNDDIISEKPIADNTDSELDEVTLLNKEMLPRLNKNLLSYQDCVVYESYESDDLNSLSFEELTSYGKYYSLEIQLYLSDKNPETYTGDIYEILVLKTADGNNEVLPKAIVEELDKRYTPFKKVDVMDMFSF